MRQFISTLAVAVFVSTCSIPITESPDESTLTKKIDTYLTETVNRLRIPGLTIAVTRNDSVLYSGAFGYTNINTKRPMKPEHVFHWASVSKTFVATAIMRMGASAHPALVDVLVNPEEHPRPAMAGGA